MVENSPVSIYAYNLTVGTGEIKSELRVKESEGGTSPLNVDLQDDIRELLSGLEGSDGISHLHFMWLAFRSANF
jgi:hypothetical protein